MTASNWCHCTVEDIAAPIRNALVGGPFGSNLVSRDYVESGVPVIRGQNMGNGRWVSGEFAFVSPGKARELSSNIARPGDLIFTQRGTLGQVAIVPDEPFEEYVVSQSQMKLTPDTTKADTRFLYYFFSSDAQQDYIRRNAIQTGVPHTNLGHLRTSPLVLPPIAEQRTIGNVLGSLDDKIELNRRMNETLETIARALFQSWFVDFDPVRAKAAGQQPAGMDAETAALFPDSFEEWALGEVPRSWNIGVLGDLAREKRIAIDPIDAGIGTPYIGLEHMPRRSIALDAWGVAESTSSQKWRFDQGDMLFGKLRPYFHKVGVAPVTGICSTDIVVITPTVESSAGIVLLLISSEQFVAFTDATSGGTRMPRTSWKDMEQYATILPPDQIIGCFDQIIRPMIAKIRENIMESRALAAARDELLPKLLGGSLRQPCDVESRLMSASTETAHR